MVTALEKLRVQDQNTSYNPNFWPSVLDTIHSTTLSWEGDTKGRVGKMVTQSNSCQKAIGLFESKTSGSDFCDLFIKRKFFLISIKEDLSPKEKESQVLLYIGKSTLSPFIVHNQMCT